LSSSQFLIIFSGDIKKWQEVQNSKFGERTSSKIPCLNELIDMLIKSYEDDVSTCLRQSCAATSVCLDALLRSKVSKEDSFYSSEVEMNLQENLRFNDLQPF